MSYLSPSFAELLLTTCTGTCPFCEDKVEAKRPTSDFKLEVETPGVKREAIVAKFKGNLLEITYKDRFGRNMSFTRPCSDKYYDRSRVDCQYENGILRVNVPVIKPDITENQEIPIEIK